MRSWSPPGLVWGGTGVRGYDAPARIGLVDPGTGEIQACVESGASERTFQRAEEPGHAGVAEDDDTPGSRWGLSGVSKLVDVSRGVGDEGSHVAARSRTSSTCDASRRDLRVAEMQGHATTSANCGSVLGTIRGDHTPCAWSNFARVPTGRRTMWSAFDVQGRLRLRSGGQGVAGSNPVVPTVGWAVPSQWRRRPSPCYLRKRRSPRILYTQFGLALVSTVVVAREPGAKLERTVAGFD